MEKMEKPVSNSPFSPFYAIGPPPPLVTTFYTIKLITSSFFTNVYINGYLVLHLISIFVTDEWRILE